MTNLERYKLLTKPFICHSDILKILETKDGKRASKIIQVIVRKSKAQGKDMLYDRGRVPSKMLIEYLDIDLDEVYQNAIKEKQLGICP